MTDPEPADDRRYPRQPLLAASAAVFRDGEVLIARRAAPPLGGWWSLPGGLVDAGERLAAAAARETLEETGVVAEMHAPADIVEVIRCDATGAVEHHYVIIAYAARWTRGEARAGDGTDAVRWVRLEELGQFELTEGTEKVIRKAAALVGQTA